MQLEINETLGNLVMSLARMRLSDFLAPMHGESNRYANMLICIGKKNPAYTSSSLRVRLAVWVQQRRSGFYTKDLFSWQIKKQLLYWFIYS